MCVVERHFWVDCVSLYHCIHVEASKFTDIEREDEETQ
jgi:hypothetical protein